LAIFVRLSGMALLLGGSIVAALAFGEMALRLIGFSYPSFHQMDPRIGSSLRPGAEGWYRKEGGSYVKINSHGLRDRERTKQKLPGTVRLAVLGDSFTEALQVPLEATFVYRLEEELNACRAFGDRKAEALNFGVSNYGTAQELLTLRERVWEYSPDIVLLAFLPANDIRNNSKALETGKNRPFFEIKNGALALDASFAEDPEWRADQRLAEQRRGLADYRLYQLLRRVRQGSYHGWNDAPAAAAIARTRSVTTLAEVGLDEHAFHAPFNNAWRDAWTVTEQLLETMHREVDERGARFVLVVLTSAAAVYPDQNIRQIYSLKLGVKDLFYPDRRVHALGAKRGFEVLSLGEAMQRHADETRKHLHGFSNTQLGFGHWNEAGHAIAAKLMAARFCPRDASGRANSE
jgi:hypothetical protein